MLKLNSLPVLDSLPAALDTLGMVINDVSTMKGWDPPALNNIGEKLALVHSEVSECLEAFRHHNPASEHIPEFTAAEEEVADTIIRLLHIANRFNMRVGEAIVAKIEYNDSRPMKHGGKAF